MLHDEMRIVVYTRIDYPWSYPVIDKDTRGVTPQLAVA